MLFFKRLNRTKLFGSNILLPGISYWTGECSRLMKLTLLYNRNCIFFASTVFALQKVNESCGFTSSKYKRNTPLHQPIRTKKSIQRSSTKCRGKHETQLSVFPYFLGVLYHLLSALQQNRAQSRLLYLFYDEGSNNFPTHSLTFQIKLYFPINKYTAIKHDGHLSTREKCRKFEPQVNVFYISRVFSNACSVLSQCNTQLRLIYLLYDIDFTCLIKHPDKTEVFDQSERAQGLIYIINSDKTRVFDKSECAQCLIYIITNYYLCIIKLYSILS